MSDFGEMIDRILRETPDHMEGRVTVDQVYAHYQHAHPEFHHPDGGGAFYLSDPLTMKARRYLGNIAAKMIGQHGVDVKPPMIENMEDLSDEVYARAPWEFGDLRASGHPSVWDGGTELYDRQPMCRRLDDEELKTKAHLRYLFDPHRYNKGTP